MWAIDPWFVVFMMVWSILAPLAFLAVGVWLGRAWIKSSPEYKALWNSAPTLEEMFNGDEK